MRGVVATLLLILTSACGDSVGPGSTPTGDAFLDDGPAFLADREVRRAALEDSLANPANGYSQLRLANYGVAGGWDELPVRNFEVRAVTTEDLGRFEGAPYRATAGEYAPAFDPSEFSWTPDALRELGRRAFHEYPLELTNRFAPALKDAASARELGLWQYDGRVGGLVRARLPDGSETFATTCATCHSSPRDGVLVDGVANAAIDNSAMSRRLAGLPGSDWGPGAADVTPDGVNNPVAIPDLRPIAHQRRLHWAATLYNSPLALAVRVETLMITSARQGMRPPRELALAVAYYLWSLADELPTPPEQTAGAAVFERECSMCHGITENALDAVDLATVATDPAAGMSTMRGTGDYRVPSLRGVGTRTQFLHEGKVKSLAQMFDPARLAAVPGHVYGTQLSDVDREELLEFLGEM